MTGAKVGVRECMEHGLIMDYPILQEKAGETVAQFKATVVHLASLLSAVAVSEEGWSEEDSCSGGTICQREMDILTCYGPQCKSRHN